MTNNVINNYRYKFIVEGLEFYKISKEEFKTKKGDIIPWSKIVTIDGLDETCNFTLYKNAMVDENIKRGDVIRLIITKDLYFKEKVIAVEKIEEQDFQNDFEDSEY